MKTALKTLIAGSTALVALAGAASAESYKIGITQNNVGVDSYQTTYEKAFIAAADANENVETVVLDAGGDVARQIAQIEDLIQQQVDAIIIWPTNGEAVIPAVRKAHKAGIPVIVTNSNIAEPGFDFVASFSGPTTSRRVRVRRRSCATSSRKWASRRGPDRADLRPAGLHDRHRARQGLRGRLPEVCPNVTLVETQPGDWNREKSQKVMEAFLVKYDDIDGVYAGDDNMGVGALNAAKAAGRDGIIFVGATNFAVGYEAMGRGEYWGSIYQSPVDDAKLRCRPPSTSSMARTFPSSTTSTRRRSPRTTWTSSPSLCSDDPPVRCGATCSALYFCISRKNRRTPWVGCLGAPAS
jgi:ribose transport system substrate-binding protein